MSSGHKREKINTNERAVSDDVNRMQAFIAQERNDIVQALLQRSFSDCEQPGVSVPSSGAAATPLAATVIDGLEIIVDSPGSVLISPGVLAAWNGTPGSADDTGIEVIIDPGIQSTGVLAIATNGGGSPRCDVIECSIVHDAVSEGGISRDIRNPTTGVFTPTNVDKVLKSTLTYRVRQGTPGSGPGYSAGWLPLGIAVVQPGATTAQVDFYDVRPLYRSLGNTKSKETASTLHPIEPNSGMTYTCSAAAIASAVFTGHADVRWDEQRYGGPLYRSSPVSLPGNFGVTSSAGGDYQNIILNNDNLLRGSGFSAVANDVIVLAAWIPDLGVDGVYLPRCVRYSEGNNPTGAPSLPTRRRAFGPDGILLAVAFSQDAISGPTLAKTLNAAGIGGCLGKGFGIPIARVQLDNTGANTFSKIMGAAEGIRTFQSVSRVLNRLVDFQQLQHSGGLNSTVVTSASPSAIASAAAVINVLADDAVELVFGLLSVNTNSSLSGSLVIYITEDFGVSGTPAIVKYVTMENGQHYITVPLKYDVTKSGQLYISLSVQSNGTNTIQVTSPMDEWGWFKVTRPL